MSGQRRYPESAVWLVGLVLLLRDVGFSLAEQKALMASRAVALDDWQRVIDGLAGGPGLGDLPPASPVNRSTKPTRTGGSMPRATRGHAPDRFPHSTHCRQPGRVTRHAAG